MKQSGDESVIEQRTANILDFLEDKYPPQRPEGFGVTVKEYAEETNIERKTAQVRLDKIAEFDKKKMMCNGRPQWVYFMKGQDE